MSGRTPRRRLRRRTSRRPTRTTPKRAAVPKKVPVKQPTAWDQVKIALCAGIPLVLVIFSLTVIYDTFKSSECGINICTITSAVTGGIIVGAALLSLFLFIEFYKKEKV